MICCNEIPAQRHLAAWAIAMISISFKEMLAEFARTQPGFTMTKARAADMPFTWSIWAKQHNSFQIAWLSLKCAPISGGAAQYKLLDLCCLLWTMHVNTGWRWVGDKCDKALSDVSVGTAERQKRKKEQVEGMCLHTKVSRPMFQL